MREQETGGQAPGRSRPGEPRPGELSPRRSPPPQSPPIRRWFTALSSGELAEALAVGLALWLLVFPDAWRRAGFSYPAAIVAVALFVVLLPFAGRFLTLFFRGAGSAEPLILSCFLRAGGVLLVAWARSAVQVWLIALALGALSSLSFWIAQDLRRGHAHGASRWRLSLIMPWTRAGVAGGLLLAWIITRSAGAEICSYTATGLFLLSALLMAGIGDAKPLAREPDEV